MKDCQRTDSHLFWVALLFSILSFFSLNLSKKNWGDHWHEYPVNVSILLSDYISIKNFVDPSHCSHSHCIFNSLTRNMYRTKAASRSHFCFWKVQKWGLIELTLITPRRCFNTYLNLRSYSYLIVVCHSWGVTVKINEKQCIFLNPC